MAQSPYVFLCDDDIEVPHDYLLKLSGYLSENPEVGIVTGCVLQKNESGEWVYQYRVTSFLKYIWNFIFQLTIWGDFSLVKTNFFTKIIFRLIKKNYQKRGNTYTMAGWPLITDFTKPVTKTSIYGLGAAIVKRDWLLTSPFDEILVPNGIGDNYGITAHLPYHQPVHILMEAHVFHHCAPENRLKSIVSYQYRVFALHYFMVKSSKFNDINILFLYWSLIGNSIFQIGRLNFNMAKTSFKTLIVLARGRNPYLKASKIL